MFIGAFKTSVRMCIGMCLFTVPTLLANADSTSAAPRWITSTVLFESANACMWAGFQTRVCQAGYRSAYRQHVRIAPAYREQEDCEHDFAPGECVASDASGLWSPWLSGFALITQARLPSSTSQAQQEREEQATQASRSWSQYLHGVTDAPEPAAHVRHFSEPLYWERDHQGGYRLTTLWEKLRNGERFANAFSKRPPVTAGSSLWTRQLARTFEPQRLLETATP